MKTHKFVYCLVLATISFFAQAETNGVWTSHDEFECAMTNALANAAVLSDSTFTNQLTLFVDNTTNTDDRANALLVLAISQMKRFENTLDYQFYNGALLVSSNLSSTVNHTTNNWQGVCAEMLLYSCFAMNGQYAAAYATATNGLDMTQKSSYQEPTNRIWQAIRENQNTSDLSLSQTFHMAAGFSAAKFGLHTEANIHATDLPEKYKAIILELL